MRRWSATLTGVALIGLTVAGVGGLAPLAANAAPGAVVPADAAASRTHLVVHPSPATNVQLVTLFATVRLVQLGGAAPTGTVTFLDGTTAVGTAPLTTSSKGRQAASVKVRFAVGDHSLTASYSGDAATAPSTSTAVVLHVTKAPPTATSTTATEVAGPGPGNATVRAFVKNATKGYPAATGNVTFKIDKLAPQMVALNTKSRAHETVALKPGTHTLTVRYPGDALHTASTTTIQFTVA